MNWKWTMTFIVISTRCMNISLVYEYISSVWIYLWFHVNITDVIYLINKLSLCMPVCMYVCMDVCMLLQPEKNKNGASYRDLYKSNSLKIL